MQPQVVGIVAEEAFVFGINIKGGAFGDFLGIEDNFPVKRVVMFAGIIFLGGIGCQPDIDAVFGSEIIFYAWGNDELLLEKINNIGTFLSFYFFYFLVEFVAGLLEFFYFFVNGGLRFVLGIVG